uniref:Putative ovule protein n=1 Tax=Solanum chacoense TaxID=4108 RepID=A0A0V0GN18_SOLCH
MKSKVFQVSLKVELTSEHRNELLRLSLSNFSKILVGTRVKTTNWQIRGQFEEDIEFHKFMTGFPSR